MRLVGERHGVDRARKRTIAGKHEELEPDHRATHIPKGDQMPERSGNLEHRHARKPKVEGGTAIRLTKRRTARVYVAPHVGGTEHGDLWLIPNGVEGFRFAVAGGQRIAAVSRAPKVGEGRLH